MTRTNTTKRKAFKSQKIYSLHSSPQYDFFGGNAGLPISYTSTGGLL